MWRIPGPVHLVTFPPGMPCPLPLSYGLVPSPPSCAGHVQTWFPGPHYTRPSSYSSINILPLTVMVFKWKHCEVLQTFSRKYSFSFSPVYEDNCLVLTLLLIGVPHVEVTDRKWTRDGAAQDAERKSVPREALPNNEDWQVNDALQLLTVQRLLWRGVQDPHTVTVCERFLTGLCVAQSETRTILTDLTVLARKGTIYPKIPDWHIFSSLGRFNSSIHKAASRTIPGFA